VNGLEQVQAMITPEFINTCIQRFLSMRTDFSETFKKVNNPL
jgi:hypothetical protein